MACKAAVFLFYGCSLAVGVGGAIVHSRRGVPQLMDALAIQGWCDLHYGSFEHLFKSGTQFLVRLQMVWPCSPLLFGRSMDKD